MNFFQRLFSQPESNELNHAVQKGAFLVDVRTPAEYRVGSVQGAVNIPLEKLNQQMRAFKGKPNVVVFCRSGRRSMMAKQILERNGISAINGGTFHLVGKAVKQQVINQPIKPKHDFSASN